MDEYSSHRNILTNGVKIGLDKEFPHRVTNDNPRFSCSEKIGTHQQLQKWLRTGVVVEPFDFEYAKVHKATLNMNYLDLVDCRIYMGKDQIF